MSHVAPTKRRYGAMKAPAFASLAPITRAKQRAGYGNRDRSRPRWSCATGRNLTLDHSLANDGVAAWISEPSDMDPASNGRGVVLLTDILGYENAETRAYAETLAEAGIPTLIPDIFRGIPWDSTRPKSEYESWRAEHGYERISDDICAAVATLRDLGAARVGLLGFCFGGGRLMDELAANPVRVNAAAAVVFYPTRFDARAAGRLAACPLMAVFADNDHLIPESVIEELQAGLGENDVMEECEIMVYENAGHAFAHHPMTQEDENDCEILKSQTAAWFATHLQ